MRYPTWWLRWRAMRLIARRGKLLQRAKALGLPVPELIVPLMPEENPR